MNVRTGVVLHTFYRKNFIQNILAGKLQRHPLKDIANKGVWMNFTVSFLYVTDIEIYGAIKLRNYQIIKKIIQNHTTFHFLSRNVIT